jgi:CHAT domain-containing protein
MKSNMLPCKFLFLTVFFTLFITPLFSMAQQDSSDKEKDTFSQAVKELKNGSYDTALNLFNTLLQIRGTKYGLTSVPAANVMTNIGVIKSQLGLYDQAIDYYKQAVAIYSSEGEKELKRLASVQQNLAICFNEKGDIAKANLYYENAERIFRTLKLSNSVSYESLLLNLTSLNLDNNNLKKAEEFNDLTFKIVTTGKYEYKKWAYKGLINRKKKNYQQSISFFNKALKVGEKDYGLDFAERELIHMNLGMVYLEMENFDFSITNYQTAKELIEKRNGNQGISYSSCLKDMGVNFLRKKENESNLQRFVIQRKKNIQTSLNYFQEAIIAITPGFTSQDQFTNPVPENAIDKTRLLDVLKNKAEALSLMAQLEEKLENNGEYTRLLKLALVTYELSIKTIHLVRNGFQNQESKLFLTENEHPVYSEAVEVAVRLYEKTGDRYFFDKGFEFSERSRSANFQSMLSELQAKEFSGLPDSLLQKETELKGEIAAYENFIFNEKSAPNPDLKKINLWKNKIFYLTQGYQEMISIVEQNYPRYYQYKYADPIVSVQKVQQSLEGREAFIEYYINVGKKNGAGELYVFVITGHEYKIIRKQLNYGFDETVNHFLKFIKNGVVLDTRKADYIQFTKNAYDLYKILIEPVVPFMQNYRLVIVPDDVLSYLPFDAFLASKGDTTNMNFRDLDYLVYHHAISYTYSATLLYHYFQNNLKYSNKIGAFAPDYNVKSRTADTFTDQFLPLPGAGAEVEGVTDIISGDQYIGASATKEIFKQNAEKYDILHLAMHTILNDTLPLYSKMVFSPDNIGNTDRTLSTAEIYNLKLKADMVVLSGCNTGSGKLQKGEGVMSMARAFLYAGCPSIIMTLWNIEDVSSSTMMIEFYRNIKNGFSKDEALRRAKISYLAQADPMKSHPYFWLGYVSIGKQIPLFKSKTGFFVGLIFFVFLAIVLEKWYFKRKKRISRLK